MIRYFCDKCEKELTDDWIELQESYTFKFRGGYGSIFGDGLQIEKLLCQNCLFDMLKGFGLIDNFEKEWKEHNYREGYEVPEINES